jgi:translocation protein SEC63
MLTVLLSFEVFDDIAFLFVLQIALMIVVFPWTAWKVYHYVSFSAGTDHLSSVDGCKCSLCVERTAKFRADAQKSVAVGNKRNLVFVLLWVVLLDLWLWVLPGAQEQGMVSSNPYEVLALADSDATEGEIKKAFRKLSLKWHPDRNPSNVEEAEQNFIMISQAYETLTDPAKKENWDLYGSAEGKSSAPTSVTIGLPSFLTKKENELPVLILYFVVFIAFPPMCVMFWWRKSQKVHESGTMKKTLKHFVQLLTPSMEPKFLVECVAVAVEFSELGKAQAQGGAGKDKEFAELKEAVKGKMAKQKVSHLQKYIENASVLLHAYLMRVDVPAVLKKDMELVLQHAHGLLSAMHELSKERKFTMTCLSTIELMQHVTQGLWPGDHPLLMLPFFTLEEVRLCKRKKINTAFQLAALSDEAQEKLLPDLSAAQLRDVRAAANAIPEVGVQAKYGLVGEEEKDLSRFYELDMMAITVSLERLSARKQGVESKKVDGGALVERKGIDEGSMVGQNGEGSVNTNESDAQDESEEAFMAKLDAMEMKPPEKARAHEAPLVHSSRFPLPKKEVWYVLVIIETPRGHIVAVVQKTKAFFDKEDVVIRFPLRMQPGKYNWEVRVMSDSYLMPPIVLKRKLTIRPRSEYEEMLAEKEASQRKEGEEEEDDYAEESSPFELSPFWSNFWDAVVLLGVGIFAYHWMVSNGHWERYVSPMVRRLHKLAAPLVKVVYPHVQPYLIYLEPFANAWNAAVTWLGEALTREVPDAVADEFDIDAE